MCNTKCVTQNAEAINNEPQRHTNFTQSTQSIR
jgi:hypothetical protein